MTTRGLTLLETLIALVVLAISVLAFSMLQTSNLRTNTDSRRGQDAVAVAQQVIEALRAQPTLLASAGVCNGSAVPSNRYTGLSSTCTQEGCSINLSGTLSCQVGLLNPAAWRVTVTVNSTANPPVPQLRVVTLINVP